MKLTAYQIDTFRLYIEMMRKDVKIQRMQIICANEQFVIERTSTDIIIILGDGNFHLEISY